MQGWRKYIIPFDKLFIIKVLIIISCSFPSPLLAQEPKVFSNLGLYGGQILDIAIDHSNPDKMFASSYMGDGLFTTYDGGNHWQAVETNGMMPGEDEFKNQKVYTVKIAPSDPGVIWAAHNYWVEKSSDGGNTWTHIRNSVMQRDCQNCGGSNDDFRFCISVAVDPDDPDVVYVGTGGPDNTYSSGGIYKTTDGGSTWEKMNGGNNFNYAVIDLAIDPQNSNVIWAITSVSSNGTYWGSLYHSNDGGQTWKLIADIGTPWYDLEIKPDEPNIIFTANWFGIVRWVFDTSTDANLQSYSFPSGIGWAFGNYVSALAFDPQNPNVLYASWMSKYVSKSTDGGQSFGTTYNTGHEFLILAVHPTDSSVVFGGEQNLGVYKSDNQGAGWTAYDDGINAVIVYDVTTDPNNNKHILAGTISGVYEKKDSGAWTRLTTTSTRSIIFHPADSNIFYAGVNGYLSMTFDGGDHWSNSNLLGNGNNYVSDIAIDRANPNTIFVAVNGYDSLGGVYKSENGGDFFNKVLEGINQSGENYPFNAVTIDSSDNLHILAGGGSFFAPKILGDLWESKDGGDHWTRTSLQNVIVNALLADPKNPRMIYAGAGYSGGTDVPLYKSTDSGQTWAESSDGLPGTPWNAVTDLKVSRENNNIIFASTLHQGVYVSNQAENWLGLGVPEFDVYAIATGSLYSATQGGLYQLTGTGVIAGKVTDASAQFSINNAKVITLLGTSDKVSQSITINGEYIMVAPAGIYSVTAIADDHKNWTQEDVNVRGGNVVWLDIAMQSGLPDPLVDPDYTSSSEGRKYCFIATAAYGSPLAQQVEVLRAFRDRYLLPYILGKKLVGFYYRTGRPAAVYIESHPWLKPPIRLMLYPLVGFAWVMLSASAPIKMLMVFCILISAFIAVKKLGRGISAIGLLILCTCLVHPGNIKAATIFQQVGVASSPNPVGSGARAIGMGGSFIAIADDATAASWNPAGLIQLEKPELSIVGAYPNRLEDFASERHPEIDTKARNDDFNLNYLSFTYPFRFHRNMVVSINYQRLYEFKRSFDYRLDYSSSGLDLVQDKEFRQDGYIGALGLASAIQITPAFSLGATLNVWTDELLWKNGWEETFSEHSVGTQGGVPVTIDTFITDKYSRFCGINANIGMLWNVNEHLTLGAVLKTPFRASLLHEFRFASTSTFGPPVSDTLPSRQNITEDIHLHMPLSYGLGVAWRVSDALSFAFDVYETDWSNFILTDSQGNNFSPIDGRRESDSRVHDTTQVRIGGEYLFIGQETVVPLRAGFFYDPEPSHESTKDFYGVAIGSGIGYRGLIFDAAYQLRWGRNVDTGNLIDTSKADITQHLLLTSLIVHF